MNKIQPAHLLWFVTYSVFEFLKSVIFKTLAYCHTRQILLYTLSIIIQC